MTTERLAEELLTFTRLLRPGRHPEMTPEQYWLLRHLRDVGSLSMGELANALGITTSSTTTACKRLKNAGLLIRERQADDERFVHVTLTEQGRDLIDTWRLRKRGALAQLLNTLEPHDQEELQRIIEHLLQVAEAQGFGEAR